MDSRKFKSHLVLEAMAEKAQNSDSDHRLCAAA